MVCMDMYAVVFIKHKTAYEMRMSDWSSDVCSSDLRNSSKRHKSPLDGERLEQLALHYAGRYATTRAKLAAYLMRKIRERGWDGAEAPEVEALITRFAELRYVDDAAYASDRTSTRLNSSH